MSILKDVPSCSKTVRNFTNSASELARQIWDYLEPLDELLKCHICFEYYDTCVITKCCHSFCSLCIRKYMTYKAQCPQCFQEATEPELRCNRQIDEVLLTYNQIKELLQPFHEKGVNISEFNHDKVVTQDSFLPSPVRNIQKSYDSRASNNIDARNAHNEILPRTHSPIAIQTSSTDCNKVSCPVCSTLVSTEKINIHLDHCLALKENPIPLENRSKRKPLPKVVYHLLSDKDIKKRLKDNGLSTSGNRQKLIKRHRTFLLLYNSECDKMNPRPVAEIVKQVEKEENEVRSTDTTKLFQSDKKSTPAKIEEENERYLKQNKSQFDSLVQEIFKRQDSSHHVNVKGSSGDEEGYDPIHARSASSHDAKDLSPDWLAETSSPELFKDVEIIQESSGTPASVEDSDEDVTVLQICDDPAHSSEDFTTPQERSRQSQRILKRKMGSRNS